MRFGAVESLFSGYFSLQAIRAQRKCYDAFVIGTATGPWASLRHGHGRNRLLSRRPSDAVLNHLLRLYAPARFL